MFQQNLRLTIGVTTCNTQVFKNARGPITKHVFTYARGRMSGYDHSHSKQESYLSINVVSIKFSKEANLSLRDDRKRTNVSELPIRPFARSGHVARNKLCWGANIAVGVPKQRN